MSEYDKKPIRLRLATTALKAEKTSKADILEAYDKLEKSLCGFAYILHDKDVYTAKDEAESLARRDEAEAAGKEVLPDINKEGTSKDAHWHVLMAFKNQKDVRLIAEAFKLPVEDANLIHNIRGGGKGYANMLAYLIHATPHARAEEKHEYGVDEVHGVVFPVFAYPQIFDGINDYSDFIAKYRKNELSETSYEVKVADGKMTPDEVYEKDPQYYLDHQDKIRRARLHYINNLPQPKTLFNYYVGPQEGIDQSGRIGKTFITYILALSHLGIEVPSRIATSEIKNFLTSTKKVYFASKGAVALQRYDGESIIIWDDVRAEDMIKTFGTPSSFFAAFDINPKPIGISIKYGEVVLKNSINIICGIQTYDDFISRLCLEISQEADAEGFMHRKDRTREDLSQAYGRVPFFLKVSSSNIQMGVKMDYLVGGLEDMHRTIKNPIGIAAKENILAAPEIRDFVCDPLLKKEQEIRDIYEPDICRDYEIPDGLLVEMPSNKDKRHWLNEQGYSDAEIDEQSKALVGGFDAFYDWAKAYVEKTGKTPIKGRTDA